MNDFEQVISFDQQAMEKMSVDQLKFFRSLIPKNGIFGECLHEWIAHRIESLETNDPIA